MGHEVVDANFKSEVLESKIPVLVDFWAQWCGPCRMLGPIIEELAVELSGSVKILKMDIDSNPQTPSELGVRSIPTMIIFQNGRQLGVKTGMLPKATILEWINSLIG